jgi:hypothetical protein
MPSTQKILLWTSILLSSCIPSPISPTLQSTPTQQPTSTPKFDPALSQLAEEFRALRSVPGQFSGGEWQVEVDQWQGQKHRLMLELALQLGDGSYSRGQIINLLGPPDHQVASGDPLFTQIQTVPNFEQFSSDGEFFVYEWRGTHDFLFFALEGDQLIGSDWWYAGE